MAQSDQGSRPLVEDFVRYKLCQRGLCPEPVGAASCALHSAMRAAGDEFEERFRQAFSEISAQIHVTPGTAYTHFAEVAGGLFHGGVNWGRVVAFFVFGAALCAESVNKEMAALLPRIQDWMVTYLETNLRDWIQSNGGWELEAIKARVREMEEEAEKLKELQNEVEKQMNMSPPPGNAGPVIMSVEEKMEADARSIYVGNVDYGATAEELEAHFHGCGSVNRVTILCDKFTGHPKGFAYIEFSDKESVRTSMALDESLFRGRQIKVVPKRTNRPGISSTDRGFPRARYRARTASYSSRSRFYSGFTARPRGRVYRGRARVTSWYSPY
ncbi:polyadenylate-binding protein 2-B isoform X3 [Bombina bombina]|uniref:polyadenylate-binding protein 2-B isoform X3 n=1 Tax=Bombina bombina TaxID=8345 RepID=UPI00235A8E51|nr:polyadenylate-binding protein 2-B isoform X3 [Bombina bombina]